MAEKQFWDAAFVGIWRRRVKLDKVSLRLLLRPKTRSDCR
ncbi:hypothetical protein CSIRO_0536 [Bradyrhizobiaceae bacterium SG-6C]|nr:hypothetical protein CSIRO_0536 [Bradyrhizobiaceae bacterium SG-6C]